MKAVIPQNSVLYDLNSRQASSKDGTYGNGKFVVTINNANKVNSCIKVLPHRVTIPNIFPNVKAGTSLRFYQGATTILTREITPWFYALDELEAAVSTSPTTQLPRLEMTHTYLIPGILLALTQETLSINTTNTVSVDASNTSILEVLGFDTGTITMQQTVNGTEPYPLNFKFLDALGNPQTYTIGTGVYTPTTLVTALNLLTALDPDPIVFSIDPTTKILSATSTAAFYMQNAADGNVLADMFGIKTSTIAPGVTSYTADEPVRFDRWEARAPRVPNLGGEKIVHVSLNPILKGNLIGSDSTDYPILTTVPLHTTPYGDYGVFSAQDLYTDDADFPQELNAQTVEVELKDASYNTLHVPLNYHVNIQLKCYHMDSKYRVG